MLASTQRPAVEHAGAGILVYSVDPHTGKPIVLIGKRVGHNWWSNFGGKSDVNMGQDSDKTLADTAVREVQEESLGLLSFTPQELAKMPSHDIINKDGILYRMYIAPHPYVNPSRLENATPVPAHNWHPEYTTYDWIPLEQLLAGLERGEQVAGEGQQTIRIDDIILYPPFLEMLKEPQVLEVLHKILQKEKVQSSHTLRTAEPFPSKPLSLEEEKQQLAETVVKHGAVIGELKSQMKPQKSKVDLEKVEAMKGYLLKDEAKAIDKSLEEAPYTQTQGYLVDVLGEEELKALHGKSNKEVETFLNTKSKFKYELIRAGADYKNALMRALEAEKLPENRGKIVFYHAVDPLSSFLYDLISAFRSQLKMLGPDKLKIFRGIESSFQTIQDVAAFIEKFKDESGEVDNYSKVDDLSYADMGLSVNPFLFGNDGNQTSCSYYMFYTMSSVYPVNIEAFFNAFTIQTGIPAKFKDYKALYEQYYRSNNQENTKLFQIFIDPQIVDTVAYAAVAGGDVLTVMLNDDTPYHGFAKIIPEERTEPEKFNMRIQNRVSGKINVNRDINNLQGRLYLNPIVFHNPKYVDIKSYWHHNISAEMEKSFQQKMHAQVSQDLTQWLVQHQSIDTSVFTEGTPVLKKLYKHVYEGVTGLKYTEMEAKNLLIMAVSRGDFNMVQKILIKNPDIDVNEKFKNIYYQQKNLPKDMAQDLSLIDLIPMASPDSVKIIKLLLEKGLDLRGAIGINGASILNLAVKNKNAEILKVLLEGFAQQGLIKEAIEHGKNNIFNSALFLPDVNILKVILKYYQNDLSILREALELQTGDCFIPFYRAISAGDMDVFHLLLKAYEKHGLLNTILDRNKIGHTLLGSVVSSGDLNKLNIVLDIYANHPQQLETALNMYKDIYGSISSVLYFAIDAGSAINMDIIDRLLKVYNKFPDTLKNVLFSKYRDSNLFQIAVDNSYEPREALYQTLIDRLIQTYQEFPDLFQQFLTEKGGELLRMPIVIGNIKLLDSLIQSFNKYPDILKEILIKNSDLFLRYAISSSNTEMINRLLEIYQGIPDLTKETLIKSGAEFLNLAISKGNLDVMNRLVEVYQGFPELLQEILKRDKGGKTPLDYAIEEKNEGVITYLIKVYKAYPELFKDILLGYLKNPNFTGRTFFSRIVSLNNLSLLNTMIDVFAEQNILENALSEDKKGDSPLIFAIRTGNIKVLNRLIDLYKAFPELYMRILTNNSNDFLRDPINSNNVAMENRVIQIYSEFPELFKDTLMKQRTTLLYYYFLVNRDDRKPEMVKLLIDAYQGQGLLNLVLKRNQRGISPLVPAVNHNNTAVAKLLLDYYMQNLELLTEAIGEDNDGNLIISKAMKEENFPMIDVLLDAYEKDPDLLEEALHKNDRGVTLLHYAAFHGRKELVDRLLIDYQKFPKIFKEEALAKAIDGKTPLDYAVAEGHPEIANRLREVYKGFPEITSQKTK